MSNPLMFFVLRDPHEAAKLVVKNGKLMIETTYTHHADPKIVHQFWPIWTDGLTVEGAEERGLVGLPAEYAPGGLYSVYDGRKSWTFRLPQRGETIAELVEYEEIPQPKTRLPARWDAHKRRWEKESKRGWVPA